MTKGIIPNEAFDYLEKNGTITKIISYIIMDRISSS